MFSVGGLGGLSENSSIDYEVCKFEKAKNTWNHMFFLQRTPFISPDNFSFGIKGGGRGRIVKTILLVFIKQLLFRKKTSSFFQYTKLT